jgi:hypothetical protein
LELAAVGIVFKKTVHLDSCPRTNRAPGGMFEVYFHVILFIMNSHKGTKTQGLPLKWLRGFVSLQLFYSSFTRDWWPKPRVPG